MTFGRIRRLIISFFLDQVNQIGYKDNALVLLLSTVYDGEEMTFRLRHRPTTTNPRAKQIKRFFGKEIRGAGSARLRFIPSETAGTSITSKFRWEKKYLGLISLSFLNTVDSKARLHQKHCSTVRISSLAMAEPVGLAASVIAIINLSAKVVKLCSDYSTAVRNARADITRLQSQLNDLSRCLQGARRLLADPNNKSLATSRGLVDSLDGCKSELDQVQTRLDPGKAGKARKTMRRFGLRTLKWPFDSKEFSGIISNLERYNQTITWCLQIDQTTILLDIQQRFEGVSLQPRRDESVARKPCFCVPFDRDPDFVDRPDILTWLKGQYTGSAGRMALVGMGGFGKSQVAIQFAHHIHDESPQTSVFWIHASSKLRFEEAYRSIAQRLELPRRNDPDVDVLGLVRDWLQTKEAGSWLMVLDNVDDVNLFHPGSRASGIKAANQPTDENTNIQSDQRPLAAYLPKCRSGTILVTSRSIDAAEKLTGSHKAIYRVSAMDDTRGFQLLRNKLNGDFDGDAAADLLRALDYIPLAITQAAAYINRRAPRASIQTYLNAFRESDKKKGSLLNRDAGDLRRDETVSNSVVTTWQVTFEQIRRERPSAAKLLSFISFFNPQGIPEFVLHDYNTDLTYRLGSDTESTDFEDDIDVLCGYSLVSMTAAQDVCEVHSLVQFCTRAWISMVDDTEQWKWVFLRSMSRHFPRGGAFETWPTCQLLLPHVESLLEEKPPDEGLQNWACLLTNCALYMLTIGNYTAAEKLGRKAVETRTKVLGEEHPDTLTSMTNLASTFRDQGRWKESEELDVGVIETKKRVLGEEHLNTLISKANLAMTYMEQGRWKEAEELQVGVMETMKRVLGEEHPDTLTSMANLASTFIRQGRWKEAGELQVGVMETRKRVLGEEHPDTLMSMANLASTFLNQGQGRWKEAEELQAGVMEMRKRVLGEEHPDTLASMDNLAVTWKEQDRTRDALALMRSCVVLRKRLLGIDHPHTALSVAVLAEWENMSDLGEE
ncbi:Kinesin light chain [Fusarium albosuccineum]|uniref:Kinesin light chain n=1 Tax=Fusarium albosuccineum TaxID=1237068 RepID=A0A8H4LLZ9_9HYPO|nr:Kinesin light chain [Fusarium albosuccineum]